MPVAASYLTDWYESLASETLQWFRIFLQNRTHAVIHCDGMRTFRPRTIRPQTVRPSDCLSLGLFVPGTVRPSDCSSIGLFVPRTACPSDCSSLGLFVPRT